MSPSPVHGPVQWGTPSPVHGRVTGFVPDSIFFCAGGGLTLVLYVVLSLVLFGGS